MRIVVSFESTVYSLVKISEMVHYCAKGWMPQLMGSAEMEARMMFA